MCHFIEAKFSQVYGTTGHIAKFCCSKLTGTVTRSRHSKFKMSDKTHRVEEASLSMLHVSSVLTSLSIDQYNFLYSHAQNYSYPCQI